jgi:hypothetical protein
MRVIVIRGCYFARDPTRGVLVSSWRKTLIENNTFFRTQMAALAVLHGDHPYYQQGAVEDLTIRSNSFIECRGGVFIQPDQPVVNRDAPVDKNITITGNRFIVGDIERPILWARSAQNIKLINNRIEVSRPGFPLVWLWGCSSVLVRGNSLTGDPAGRIEVVDYSQELVTNRVIQADRNWNVVKGGQREGTK